MQVRYKIILLWHVQQQLYYIVNNKEAIILNQIHLDFISDSQQNILHYCSLSMSKFNDIEFEDD